MEGARSARERRASDQLKPSPSRRGLDLSSWGDVEVLAGDRGLECEAAGAGVGRAPLEEAGENLPLPMLPVRASRNA